MRRKTFFVCFLLAMGLSVAAKEKRHTTLPPIMGWSSWNTYRIHISDSLIMRQADAMVSQGLKNAGYSYVNIDDGFFGYRDEEGMLQTHPKRFPRGLKHVVEHIHGLGLKAGIYSDAGANTCGSMWDADPNGVAVGLYGHEEQDADLFFNKLGFDYIKIDYCGAGQQLELEEQKRYTTICEAIRKVCRRDISVNICRWAFPGVWAADMARSWRISGDINASWGSVRSIIEKNLYLSAFAHDGHYNDMDMLEIGRGLRPEEEEVHFGMWCIMSSPLLIGCDLTRIPAQSLSLLKNTELIALNQDPLALQAHVVQHEGEGYVLVKDLEKLHGTTRAVALYNPSDTLCAFNVPMEVLELGGTVRVRDLIHHRDEAQLAGGNLACTLPAHSVRIFKMEADRRVPSLRYEAEWAYLPLYDDLGTHSRPVGVRPCEEASGRMVVTNLGGSEENCAEWKDVCVDEAGTYEMTITYMPFSGRQMEVNDRIIEVEVNGKRLPALRGLDTSKSGKPCTVSLPVSLKMGANTVRLGSRYTWTPDIDCFTLKKK